LSIQREALRLKLVAQRQLIAQQLEPGNDSHYPRSATMRFLKHSTVPAVKMVGGVATLFGGLRMYRTIAAVLAAVGTLRVASRK
jgi:hypothetical protein